MATVTITRYECNRDLLPPVCAVCGAPAANRVRVTYMWNPRWADFLLVGPVFLARRMSVHLPLCKRHLRNRRRRNVATLVSVLAILALGAASYVCMQLWPGRLDDPPCAGMCGGCVLLFVAWGLVVAVVDLRVIRASEITDRSLTLSNVSGQFVLAVESTRALRDDEPDARLRYDDVRDDYDEDRGLPRTD